MYDMTEDDDKETLELGRQIIAKNREALLALAEYDRTGKLPTDTTEKQAEPEGK